MVTKPLQINAVSKDNQSVESFSSSDSEANFQVTQRMNFHHVPQNCLTKKRLMGSPERSIVEHDFINEHGSQPKQSKVLTSRSLRSSTTDLSYLKPIAKPKNVKIKEAKRSKSGSYMPLLHHRDALGSYYSQVKSYQSISRWNNEKVMVRNGKVFAVNSAQKNPKSPTFLTRSKTKPLIKPRMTSKTQQSMKDHQARLKKKSKANLLSEQK